MRTRAGTRRRAVPATLAVAALALGACQGNEAAGPPAPASAAAPPAAPQAAEKARVGTAADGCALPVSFGIAESWKPKAVRVEADDVLAELTRRGPLTMACEIDAKPAGSIGFLRVWTGPAGEPRPALTAFIGDRAQDAVFTELPIGGRPGLEVVYRQKSQLDDALEPERAFLVPTGQGIAVVSLDSFDSDEHDDMLPAYELGKAGLTVTG
ncbi:lipoprotein [Actinoplanes sp. M2I2]|uniref:lipoprotein n=1 Tax=Actinoplanes sp. M2I2 TaxID=1734444 RepID=UPI002020FBCB|nr:lipoprotein [Actinoplanes sp. M2I2]